MNRLPPFFFAAFLCAVTFSTTRAGSLSLGAPLDFQVIQRAAKAGGRIPIQGTLNEAAPAGALLEARLGSEGHTGDWQPLPATFPDTRFEAALDVPAGGWYRLEVRLSAAGAILAQSAVEHVGIGEVFVVAGQSNAANHGEVRQSTQTGLVATFDGQRWQLSKDPQPGASGGGGSFLPPFGDAIARQFKVPVGFVACGIGATSVREWLPKGVTFPNPPTLLSRVQQRDDGRWESKGAAYEMFIARLKALGPRGFRAVLWHQGESDAHQADATRTLAGENYRQYLTLIIQQTRRDLGWEAPWFVAQVSYHIPGDEASADIRSAQAALWKDGTALEGPDSDALKAEWREAGGRGVHFSGPGLSAHAARWVEKIAPWLLAQ